jgi:transmembrane sensor
MDLREINELIKKYTNDTATEAERRKLKEWYRQNSYQETEFPGDEMETYHSILNNVKNSIKPQERNNTLRNLKWAASVLLFLSAGLTVYFTKFSDVRKEHKAQAGIISPGGNKAVLTLANGEKISLTDALKGYVARQSGIHITKAAGGQVIYTTSPDSSATVNNGNTVAYNTIETPIGGQFQIILPDGTKVWLNSLSSIKFPVSFARSKERRVELTGEAYFDVKHSENYPFRVITRGQITEDIGTEFNINAYPENVSVKTTLIKGSVRILSGNQSTLLKPGEQADLSTRIKVMPANIDAVVAWKDGYFKFDDDNLEEIMKQIARWYAVKVVFKDESLKTESYGAVITRSSKISSLINLMQQAGNADFEIEGNTIMISRKKKNL